MISIIGTPLRGCQLTDLFNRRHADFTRRLVDNAAQAHVVPRVYDDGQIAVDVLDLLAVKEALAAHNAVRDARAGKVGLDRVRLSVHAVEHGVVLQARALSQMLADDVRNVAGLVLLVRSRCSGGPSRRRRWSVQRVLPLRPMLFLMTLLAAFRILAVER